MSRRVQRVSDFLIVRIGRRRRETVPGDPQVASHQGDGIDVDGLGVKCPERRFRPSEREIAEMLSKTKACRLKGFNPRPARVSPVDDSHNRRYVNQFMRGLRPPRWLRFSSTVDPPGRIAVFVGKQDPVASDFAAISSPWERQFSSSSLQPAGEAFVGLSLIYRSRGSRLSSSFVRPAI